MGLFKAYDVRGVYPSELNERIAEKIALASASELKPKKVLIARDMRLSSPVIAKSIIKGSVDSGADVIDAGLCSSPMFYFIMGKYNYDLGLMITASHNPKEYNGLKFMKKGNIAINYESGLNKVEEIFKKGDFNILSAEKKGKIETKDFRREYKEYILNFFKDVKFAKKRIVLDAGNGMAGYALKDIFASLPFDVKWINFNPDGNFPSHESNPLAKGVMEQLKKAVIDYKADIGTIFDGDADRIFFVDENGKDIDSSLICAMLADYFVSKKYDTIVHDAMNSRVIKEIVGERGKVVRVKVGYSYISKGLRENKAVLGAEVSGHYSYRDNFYSDSGIITLLKVLEIIGNKKFSDVLRKYQKYHSSGEINFTIYDKDKTIKKIAEHFKNARIDYLDGITIDYDDFWFVLRPSNTEPLLRLRLEAINENLVKEKVQEIKKLIAGL